MNFLKTPQQMLMEEAGMAPASPGLLHTPRQMLMQESGIVPKMAEGGQPEQQQQMSPQDMMAIMMAYGQVPQHLAAGGQVFISPQDMMAAYGQAPQYFAEGGQVDYFSQGGAATSKEFEAALESARRQPGFLKKGASKVSGAAGKLFNRLNPAFQVMAAEDAGSRTMDAAERAYQGDYRGAAISGLGALGSGVGMAPGFIPQVVSIPLTMGADYLQEYFDEKDPHKSRASLKIQN
jgi:hypothetical protein